MSHCRSGVFAGIRAGLIGTAVALSGDASASSGTVDGDALRPPAAAVRTRDSQVAGAQVDHAASSGDCGTTLLNADGSYEDGYSWQYGGLVSPTYGALAECYQGQSTVCGAFFDFTGVGYFETGLIDVYVWVDDAGRPGAVLCARFSAHPPSLPMWPDFARFHVDLPECCTGDAWWVGYWGDWPGQQSMQYVGADLDGPGGCPMTNIAPGLGWPSGWQSVDLVWGTTAALGIGAEVQPCLPVPTQTSSWGSVKRLYR